MPRSRQRSTDQSSAAGSRGRLGRPKWLVWGSRSPNRSHLCRGHPARPQAVPHAKSPRCHSRARVPRCGDTGQSTAGTAPAPSPAPAASSARGKYRLNSPKQTQPSKKKSKKEQKRAALVQVLFLALSNAKKQIKDSINPTPRMQRVGSQMSPQLRSSGGSAGAISLEALDLHIHVP